MTQEKLWALRREIVLNSIFLYDYANTFGFDRRMVSTFFDGYLEYLDELMQESIPDYDDANFFDLLSQYDTAENLWDWYGCLEEDPLPLPPDDEED